MDKINEFASEKTKFRRTLFGTRNNIFTVCIASADNPMGVKYTEKENQKRRKDLEELLSKHRLKYYKVKGKYGNEETSYVIANINIALCEFLFGPEKFNQESFIFGIVKEYGSIVFSYMEQTNEGNFIEKDASKEIKGQKEAEDYFTSYLGYKFQIPFSIFESTVNRISNDLERDFGWNKSYTLTLENLALKENPTLGYLYRHANVNLLTEEQEKRRVENLERILGNVKN